MTQKFNKISKYKGMFYSLVFSPDDGGYYAEIFDAQGKDLHETEIKRSWDDAEADVTNWIDAHQ